MGSTLNISCLISVVLKAMKMYSLLNSFSGCGLNLGLKEFARLKCSEFTFLILSNLASIQQMF